MDMEKDTRSPGEFEQSPPQKEKTLALESAFLGAFVGGIIFLALTAIPAFVVTLPYTNALLIGAVVLGAILGSLLGPLVSLRISRYLRRKKT